MGKSTPDAPDYEALAQQQGELNREAATAQTAANRPDQITPWGKIKWEPKQFRDPVTGQKATTWRQETTLRKPLQRALEDQQGVIESRSDTARGLTGDLRRAYQDPLDYDQFRDVTEVENAKALRRHAEDAMYDRSTSRLDPRFEDEAEKLSVDLRNRGLRPGDQAYEAEMDRFNRGKTDAYQAALNESVGAGRAEAGQIFGQQQSQQAQSAALRQQEIVEALQARNMPLNEINALLAGQGISSPTAPNVPYAQGFSPANVLGAASSQYGSEVDAYNARQGQQQGLFSGLMNLGTSALGFFSDRRLKRDIARLGAWRGYPLYVYSYLWGQADIGVMADEVNQDAVTMTPMGAVVDYAKVR